MNICADRHKPADYVLPGTPSGSPRERGVQKRSGFILSHLDRSTRRVLDVGCGEGVYLDVLSAHAEVVGVDLNAAYLCTARMRSASPNVRLARMAAQRPAFADHTFDAIVLIETLEHLNDGQAAIAELARVLRPGGQLLITVPNKLFPVETHSIRMNGRIRGSRWGTGTPLLPLLPHRVRRTFATVRLYYSWELRKLLESNGFTVCKIGYLMPSLDSMERMLPQLPVARWLRGLAARLERSPFRWLGSTILVQAKKTET